VNTFRMIGLFLILATLVAGCIAQRKGARPTTEADCLAWLHGHNGYDDGYTAMLSQINPRAPRLTSECIKAAQEEIAKHAKELVDSGRYTQPGGADGIFTEIAVYRWFLTDRATAKGHASNASYSDSDPLDTQMGMYVFDPYLFSLAMRSWYTNVFMEKGSDIVHAPDVTFDPSVVGFQTYVVTDQEYEGDDCTTHRAKLEAERKERERKGKTIEDEIRELNAAGSTATLTVSNGPYVLPPKPQPSIVTGLIDAHTIRLSRRAKGCVNGYAAMFVPPEWSIDLCNCTH
jgi:hypothetical protein